MPIPAAFDLSGRVSWSPGMGGPDGIGYTTAKAGMIGLTRATAVETARAGAFPAIQRGSQMTSGMSRSVRRW